MSKNEEFDEDLESLEELEENESVDNGSMWDDEEEEWDRDSYFDEEGIMHRVSDDDDDFDYDESDYEEE